MPEGCPTCSGATEEVVVLSELLAAQEVPQSVLRRTPKGVSEIVASVFRLTDGAEAMRERLQHSCDFAARLWGPQFGGQVLST